MFRVFRAHGRMIIKLMAIYATLGLVLWGASYLDDVMVVIGFSKDAAFSTTVTLLVAIGFPSV